jgi:hypothetical protein
MRLHEFASLARRAAITGTIAGVASAAFIAIASQIETGSPASGINGATQVFHGRAATRERRIDMRHTLVGWIVHQASAYAWAGVHESKRLREMAPHPGVRALLVMAAAGVLDYGLLPRRLTPGLEGQLSRRTIVATFSVIAAALAFGSWLQDRPVRLTAAHVRRLLGGHDDADSGERRAAAAHETPLHVHAAADERVLP